MSQRNPNFMGVFLAVSITAGCGSANFASNGSRFIGNNLLGEREAAQDTGSPATGDGEEKDGDGAAADKDSVSWNWPCGTQTKTDPYPLESKIEGSGVFLTENNEATYKVSLTGEVCDGPEKPRDVLFLFDASASMKRNDRQAADGSCGRLNAMKAVAEKLGKQENVRFGLVTFSRSSKRTLVTSGNFYATIDEMAAAVSALEGGDDFNDIVCDDYHLGTNYNAGFGAALDLISVNADPDAHVDLLFVSDGKPTRGNDGATEVASLKKMGVTIATVMVKGKEDILKNSIASSDSQGQPLHAQIDGINALADTLAALAGKMQPAASLSWRMIGDTAWNTTEVQASVTGTKFTVAAFPISKATTPAGIEVEYAYYEKDTKVKATGSIKWKEAKPVDPVVATPDPEAVKPEVEPAVETGK